MEMEVRRDIVYNPFKNRLQCRKSFALFRVFLLCSAKVENSCIS